MKKIALFFLCFITACTSTSNYNEEFKNPIFNQPLRPLSRTVGYEYLTPTAVD